VHRSAEIRRVDRKSAITRGTLNADGHGDLSFDPQCFVRWTA
jgi:hypothetical protein